MKNFRLPLLISVSFISVLLMNYLANVLPLGGITTGEASDRLPNLFTPTGATFSIWGLIYTLLLAYIVAFWIQRPDQITGEAGAVTQAHSRWLVINFGANVLWILAWHHLLIGLSMGIMLLILHSLIRMAQIGMRGPQGLRIQHLLRQSATGLYFGWITVATIANATALLVSLQFSGWGISEPQWTSGILLVGALIASASLIKFKNPAYGVAVLWALIGIWSKHTDPEQWNFQFPLVIKTTQACLVLVGSALFYSTYSSFTPKTTVR
ncbi:MAG: hypothetical protein ACO306_04160 [Flavobacteriaceae bacterium]